MPENKERPSEETRPRWMTENDWELLRELVLTTDNETCNISLLDLHDRLTAIESKKCECGKTV